MLPVIRGNDILIDVTIIYFGEWRTISCFLVWAYISLFSTISLDLSPTLPFGAFCLWSWTQAILTGPAFCFYPLKLDYLKSISRKITFFTQYHPKLDTLLLGPYFLHWCLHTYYLCTHACVVWPKNVPRWWLYLQTDFQFLEVFKYSKT